MSAVFDAQDTENVQVLDLLAEESWRSVHAGELKVRDEVRHH